MKVPSQGLLAILILTVSLSIGLLISFSVSQVRTETGSLDLERELSTGTVAVMFWSETCSACENMRPYWMELERAQIKGVKVLDVPLIAGQTDKLFLKYRKPLPSSC